MIFIEKMPSTRSQTQKDSGVESFAKNSGGRVEEGIGEENIEGISGRRHGKWDYGLLMTMRSKPHPLRL